MEPTAAELKKYLESNPFKYKQCTLHIESEHNMYAKVRQHRVAGSRLYQYTYAPNCYNVKQILMHKFKTGTLHVRLGV